MRKPSAATAIAITALVVAAAGTGAAATHYAITNKNQIAPKVRAQLHGAQGKRGPKGDPGTNGTNGTPGATGATGPAGPGGHITALASGQTETGDFTIFGPVPGAATEMATAVSFAFPLNFSPTFEYVAIAGGAPGNPPDQNCPASGTAAPGYLCIYGLYDKSNDGPIFHLGHNITVLEFGAQFFVQSASTSTSVDLEGTWAVTAP